MSIHIHNLQVQNLGPLESLQESLKRVNLFYGLNESGKTYLVEFLIHSLFRHPKNWGLRERVGTGSIQVQGIREELITFSPESSRKIESYWEEEDGAGLPLNLGRLLVVKGGELDLASGSPGGVDRDTLKSAVTSQALLDQLWDSISSTVRNAALEDGHILGSKRGPLKTHIELLEEIQQLENLLEQIENRYSQGPAREVENQINIIRDKLEDQGRAKRHLAYRIWKNLEDLKGQRETLSEKDLQNLRDSIRDLGSLDKDIGVLEEKLADDKERGKHYPWLDTALEIWEARGLDKSRSPSKPLGIIGLASLGIGAALMFLENYYPLPELIWIGIASAGIGLALSLFFSIQYYRWEIRIDESKERKSIQEEYEKLFGTPLGGLADLKTRKAALHEAHLSAQTRQSLLDGKINQRELQRQSIENSFIPLIDEALAENSWQPAIADLTQKSESLDQQILENKLQLSALNIPEDAYYQGQTKVEFDPEIVQRLESDLKELESSLSLLQSDLDNLKNQACGITRDDISDPWTEVLHNLQSRLRKRSQEYRTLTAELVAKIGLTEVLTRLREEEDQKIIQAINTDSIATLLNTVTGRYHKLSLVDDQLFAHDAFREYPLHDLSTGAREQVQLALRMGIASQTCGGNPLFLILDDAFQHSDWKRRETLVRSTLDLAQSGWQIIYLSMDDHIRDLFLKIVKPAFKKDFKLIELD